MPALLCFACTTRRMRNLSSSHNAYATWPPQDPIRSGRRCKWHANRPSYSLPDCVLCMCPCLSVLVCVCVRVRVFYYFCFGSAIAWLISCPTSVTSVSRGTCKAHDKSGIFCMGHSYSARHNSERGSRGVGREEEGRPQNY